MQAEVMLNVAGGRRSGRPTNIDAAAESIDGVSAGCLAWGSVQEQRRVHYIDAISYTGTKYQLKCATSTCFSPAKILLVHCYFAVRTVAKEACWEMSKLMTNHDA